MSYVFSDFKNDLSLSTGGTPKVLHDEDVIIQSLRTIFSTVSGERVRNPIGSALVRLLFQPISAATANKVERELRRSIETYEPRVNIRSINVIPYIDNNTYEIIIDMTIRDINKRISFRNRLRSLATV